MNLLKMIFGTKHERDIKYIKPIVQKINDFEPSIQGLSDEDLAKQTVKFRERLAKGEELYSILPEAYATVREAAKRALGERHYDVQLIGGIVLFQNKIAEMKTGEGKTLTATLPLYLHGLTQKGAHCVTVNDYLAQRDSAWMGKIYSMLGVTVGCIINDLNDEQRQQAYGCDITYGTNNEFAFDYLRDNMKFDLSQYVQKEHNYCIVDEVDSILVDEARTPLLISGQSDRQGTGLYRVADQVVRKLQITKHFTLDEKSKSAIITEDGHTYVQEVLKIDDLFSQKHSELLHHLNQALRSHHLFKLDVDYVLRDGKIIIVDEFTGRLKTGSRWSDGLHQAIEAKEGVTVVSENQTLASITFQNYFRLYKGLSGMTGTADTEAEEFAKIYNLDVVVIPTNVLVNRLDHADVIYKSRDGKYKATIELIKILYEKGQPTLVGTISIDNSELISERLKKLNIPHQVLNAKQHESEAQIIANAGQLKAITIATNMAGRGTDIKLTKETKALGGLYIIGTERHESRRIDNQLRGRSGRQGDPGESKFFLSLEDDLMRIFGSDRMKGIMTTFGMKEDEPIEHRMITNAIAKAQKKVEGHHFEIRKHLLEYDNVMNEQRQVIYKIRREILADKDNLGFIYEMLEEVSERFIDTYKPEKKVPLDEWPWDEINKGFAHTYHFQAELTSLECSQSTQGNLSQYINQKAKDFLQKKFASYDPEQVRLAIKEILLSIFDAHWKDHLLAMDHLKEGMNLRAYAQKDPLNEYKRESFTLFQDMKVRVKQAVIEHTFSVQLYTPEEIEELKRKQREMLEAQLEAYKRAQEHEQKKVEGQKAPVKREMNKVGRNDPCPCGSGKKFKHCHGA